MHDALCPLTLQTERLNLSLPGPWLAPRLAEYFETNRAHLQPWEPPFPNGLFTKAFWERRLVQNQQEYQAGQSLRLVMVDRAEPSGSVLGLANFTQFIRGAFMACTLGYSLGVESQGQGLMTEGLHAAIRHVFEGMGMHRIMANYIPGNDRSKNLLERLGFQTEGLAPAYLYINDRWQDHVLTALVNDRIRLPDYLQTRQAPVRA